MTQEQDWNFFSFEETLTIKGTSDLTAIPHRDRNQQILNNKSGCKVVPVTKRDWKTRAILEANILSFVCKFHNHIGRTRTLGEQVWQSFDSISGREFINPLLWFQLVRLNWLKMRSERDTPLSNMEVRRNWSRKSGEKNQMQQNIWQQSDTREGS